MRRRRAGEGGGDAARGRRAEKVRTPHKDVGKKEYYYENHEACLQRSRAWREQHPQYKRDMGKKYQDTNKETIVSKLKEKKLCECGCYISLRNLSAHKRRQKHIDLMAQHIDLLKNNI